MSELDFHIEFFIEIPELEDEIYAEAEQRLRDLAVNRNDLIGASVTVENLTGTETAYLYQARIVAYMKPENITAIEKNDTPKLAIKDALSTIERRVREERSKLRKSWQRPDLQKDLSLYDLSAREIYDAYVGQPVSKELLDQDREKIAAKLMIAEKMDQESAYYAADRILEHHLQMESQ